MRALLIAAALVPIPGMPIAETPTPTDCSHVCVIETYRDPVRRTIVEVHIKSPEPVDVWETTRKW